MTFGKLLKKLRMEKSLNQLDTAKLLGIAQSTYANYEIDNREPDFNTLLNIANFFNVSTDYLLGRELNTNKVSDSTLDAATQELLTVFLSLNDEGRNMVLGHAKYVSEAKKYTLRGETEKDTG